MSEQIQQKDINNATWLASDTFREMMDSEGYKDNILVMPLRYGGNDKPIWRRLKNERLVLPESSFYDLISAVDSEGHKSRLYTLDTIISGDYRVTVTSITTSEDHAGGIADIDREAITSDDRADGLAQLIQSWMAEGDADEQRETLEHLIHALDEDRLSDRKLFPKELKGKSW